MSEFHVEVVQIGPVEKHPNADALSITSIHGGYPVIFRTGDYAEGDLAVYVPVDSVVPATEQWAFLGTHRRIKAKKLRGVFSMGLLAKQPEGTALGNDVAERMGITRWELVEPAERAKLGGQNEVQPSGWTFPKYTDIEPLRRYHSVFEEGEEVVFTEKIHGANGRYCYGDGELWVGSHNFLKRRDSSVVWWQLAEELELERKLSAPEMDRIAVFGEVYGRGVQDLQYATERPRFIVFDMLDTRTGRYLDHDETLERAAKLGLTTVPELYRGPWSKDLMSHTEGLTVLGEGKHVREGFVAKPVKERWHSHVGRVIFKAIGEGYHLRKGG